MPHTPEAVASPARFAHPDCLTATTNVEPDRPQTCRTGSADSDGCSIGGCGAAAIAGREVDTAGCGGAWDVPAATNCTRTAGIANKPAIAPARSATAAMP